MKILFSSGANINGGPVKKKVNIKQLPNSTILGGNVQIFTVGNQRVIR